MKKFRKTYNLKIILVIVSMLFLRNAALYSYSLPNYTLRLHVGDKEGTYRRFQKLKLIQLTNDWRNYEKNEEEILALSCSLLGIDNVSDFKLKRPVKPVVLAGGRATRLKASGIDTPKALVDVNSTPSICYVLDTISSLPIAIEKPLLIVADDEKQAIEAAVGDRKVDYCIGDRPLGTGYFVLQTERILEDFDGDILVIYSSQPVIKPETLFKSILIHQAIGSVSMTLPTTARERPYASLVRAADGRVVDSLETNLEGDATPKYGEDNIGAFIVRREDLFDTLHIAHISLFDVDRNEYSEPGELGFPNNVVRTLAERECLVLALAMADPREQQGIKLKKHMALTGRFRTELVEEKITELTELVREKDEYLMGRQLVNINLANSISSYTGKRVLITGAAGSLGSTLSQYLSNFNLRELVLLDKDRENLLSLEEKLKRDYPFLKIVTIVADIRDKDRIEQSFRNYRPDFVFHAAANKYTDQLEDESNQIEGIETNIIGTRNLIEASQDNGVDSFVFISSDKAAVPSTFYGATKKAGELLMQAHRDSNTRFITARCVNFLGSRGSIVPVLESQIAKQGTVSVQSGPRRYFISVSEAAKSAIKIGTLGQQGEIYIVSFGRKVLISDLVKRLVNFSGKKVDFKDMPLRPGDTVDIIKLKKHERKIAKKKQEFLVFSPDGRNNKEELLQEVALLESLCRQGDIEEVVRILRDIVPEYGFHATEVLPEEKDVTEAYPPLSYRLKPTGEKLDIIPMDVGSFKKHRAIIIDIAKTLYDKSPVLSLEFGDTKAIEGHPCYLAKLDGDVVGYVFAYEDNGVFGIWTLGVAPSKQGKGIANTLVWTVAKEARNRGIDTVVVKGVELDNKNMIKFLKNHGFELYKVVVQGNRADFKAPVDPIIRKTKEKMDRDMTVIRESRLRHILTSFIRVLKSAI